MLRYSSEAPTEPVQGQCRETENLLFEIQYIHNDLSDPASSYDRQAVDEDLQIGGRGRCFLKFPTRNGIFRRYANANFYVAVCSQISRLQCYALHNCLVQTW